MKLTFLGCGSAFTTQEYYQSNVLITKNGKHFLLDIGTDIRFSLAEAGLKATDIDAFTVTHAHADHCGGIEWLAFSTKFIPNHKKPTLFGVDSLLDSMWNHTLSGGMKYIANEGMPYLNTFFDVQHLNQEGFFVWENIEFTAIKTRHVKNDFGYAESYAYYIKDLDTKKIVFFTGDTVYDPATLSNGYWNADLIFHECETGFKSGVHCHYDELVTLRCIYKNKMWLYHYQPNPPQHPLEDNFLGFVKKGQSFEM